MPTIIFDFDSTLVSIETLDTLLTPKLTDPTKSARFKALTKAGMQGDIPFAESLQKRLEIATPTQAEVALLANTISAYFTPGIPSLIKQLQAARWDIWIISGGLKSLIIPAAHALGIQSDHVCAVEALWTKAGDFKALDHNKPFNVSKVAGFHSVKQRIKAPIVVVGDGMTDCALYQAGLVGSFIAFIQHKQHQRVIDAAPFVASNVEELKTILAKNF